MDEKRSAKSESEWKASLTPSQYHILRERGTEGAFTGKYVYHKEDGTYVCAGCGQELFRSEAKFDSGSGWPSFYEAVSKDNIELRDDYGYGMHRIEVRCRRCGGHLGHVFDDGPKPTGQRYCINSKSLDFQRSDVRKTQGPEHCK
jgi:peptide-methionine (R)-S-oxide reductase